MDKKTIERINALAKKSRTLEGLTAEEKAEQDMLRREYIEAIKSNFRSTLENIEFTDEKK